MKSLYGTRCCLRRKSWMMKSSRSFSTTKKLWKQEPNAPITHRSDNFWKEQSNQRRFFDQLGKKIGIQKPDDWYPKLSSKVIAENGGDDGLQLVRLYKNSSAEALMAAYPEYDWVPWKFNIVPTSYWKSLNNQRRFFDWLGKELGIQQLDDWYQKLSTEVFMKNGASGLLCGQHGGSPVTALMAAYPEHNWIPWKFSAIPKSFWAVATNQRKFFDYLGKVNGIQNLDDWYGKLTVNLVEEHAGAALDRHGGSPIAALIAAYPEHNWIPWKFNRVPTNYWRSIENQRKYFDWLGKELEIQQLDDWYEKLSMTAIRQRYGGGVLKNHNGSAVAALMAAYPEHNWIPWKFMSSKKWRSSHNINEFLSELSEKLSIQTLDDWYRVDFKQLRHFSAGALLNKYKGLYNLLKEQYPNHPWDSKRFQQTGKKTQRWLAVTLKKMFPNEEILEDYLHPRVTLPTTKRPMQLDVFIPAKSLAFEYQGIQHYEDVVGVFSPTRSYQQRDEEKRILCAANNIKLIEVPYWWNRTPESLQEMIA